MATGLSTNHNSERFFLCAAVLGHQKSLFTKNQLTMAKTYMHDFASVLWQQECH